MKELKAGMQNLSQELVEAIYNTACELKSERAKVTKLEAQNKRMIEGLKYLKLIKAHDVNYFGVDDFIRRKDVQIDKILSEES